MADLKEEDDDTGLVYIDLASHAPDDEFISCFDASGYVGDTDCFTDDLFLPRLPTPVIPPTTCRLLPLSPSRLSHHLL